MFEISELKAKKLPELQELAKTLGVPKFRSLKKLDLVYQILDYQATNPNAVKAVATEEKAESAAPAPAKEKREEAKPQRSKDNRQHNQRSDSNEKRNNNRNDNRGQKNVPQP